MHGWVQGSLGIFLVGKSSQNSSKPVLICLSSRPPIPYSVLLKVVSYSINQSIILFADTNIIILAVNISDRVSKKNWMGCELYPSLFWIFVIVLTLQSL